MKHIICLVCGVGTGFYRRDGVEPGTWESVPYPLYQRSYEGEPEYISPRCSRCYDKVVRKELAGVQYQVGRRRSLKDGRDTHSPSKL